MKKLVIALYIGMLVILAVATFAEYGWGSDFATETVYHSPFFVLWWAALVVLTLMVCYRKKIWKQVPVGLLHLSFVVILLGAGLSFLTSRKGVMHLRIGQQSFRYMEQEEGWMHELPFTLSLDTFYVEYYPGTETPSDYISVVRCSALEEGKQPVTIAMNKVFDCKGFRFYQASYDEDERGTVLSVNYDPWGTGVTYIGYALLALSMVGMLLSRLLLYPAVFLLGLGIFVGAVWANVSWGRYWAWDPKEVWALITFMVYGLPFHTHSLARFRKPKFLHIYLIVAFLTVLMTYFGVNFFLGGMHSYA